MRVTYVVNALGEGGTERSLADLLPGLRDAGVDIRIVTLRSRGSEGVEPLLRKQGFPIETIGSIGRARTLRRLRRLLKEEEPDIVHSMLFEANLYARLASIGLPVKTLVSLVNTTYSAERMEDPRLNRAKVRSVQALEVALARLRTTHFHAVSTAVQADAEAGLRVRGEKITVVERGRRAETLPPPSPARRATARSALDIPETAPVLVAVGRQEYQKAHRYLIEATDHLPDIDGLQLLIAGREGNESKALQRLLQTSPSRAAKTRLLGHRSDVANILAAADLFVFPSLFEGMPGAVIEAMSAGLPIIASDIPPVREVVEPEVNARLVPLRDSGALADAIAELLSDEVRRAAMGERSRQIFEERFTMERSVAQMFALYTQLSSA